MEAKGTSGSCLLPIVAASLTLFSATVPATLVSIEAHSHQTRFFGLDSPTQTVEATGPLGDPAIQAETLVTSDGLRFFTRTTGPAEPVFSSALARGDSFYGVGASGITGMSTNDVAEARVSYTFENPIDHQIGVTSLIHVEPIEALAWVLSSFDGTEEFGPISVIARLQQTATVTHSDGTVGPTFDVFDLNLDVRRNDSTSKFERNFSDDLRILFGQVDANGEDLVKLELVDETVNGNRVFGTRVDAFDVDWHVATLESGESVLLEFLAQVMVNREAETGGQAFIGDPFRLDVTGTPNISVTFHPLTSAVSEPPAGVLLFVALVLLAAQGRARSPASVRTATIGR